MYIVSRRFVNVKVNVASQFIVDFNGAQGKLEAKVVAPSGAETEAVVQQVQNGKTIYYWFTCIFMQTGILKACNLFSCAS